MEYTEKELKAMESLIMSRRGKKGAKNRWEGKSQDEKRLHALKMVEAKRNKAAK